MKLFSFSAPLLSLLCCAFSPVSCWAAWTATDLAGIVSGINAVEGLLITMMVAVLLVLAGIFGYRKFHSTINKS